MPAIARFMLLSFRADPDGTWFSVLCLNPACTTSTFRVEPAAPSDTCFCILLHTPAVTDFTFLSHPAAARCTWSDIVCFHPAGTLCALCLVSAAPLGTCLSILLHTTAVTVFTFLSNPAVARFTWSDVVCYHPACTTPALCLVPAAPVYTCLSLLLHTAAVMVFTFLSNPAVARFTWSDVVCYHPACTTPALCLVPAAPVYTCLSLLLHTAAVTVVTSSGKTVYAINAID